MKTLIDDWKTQLYNGKAIRLAFTEFTDQRVLTVIKRLMNEKIVIPVLIGDEQVLSTYVEEHDLTAVETIGVKGNLHTFSVEQLKKGKIDALISGAVFTTKDVMQPALDQLKRRTAESRISGAFILSKGDERYLFADCSMHIEPSAKELASIAIESVETAKKLHIEPKIAFLSYTTKAVRKDDSYVRIHQAIEKVKKALPEVPVDGELQFDSAFSKTIAKQKTSPTSDVGDATIFIFPNLESGNIACKLIQLMSTYDTLGPVVQGFQESFQDLSRGATVESIYQVAIYAAYQALDHVSTTS